MKKLRSDFSYEKRKRREKLRKSKELKADVERRKRKDVLIRSIPNPINPFFNLILKGF